MNESCTGGGSKSPSLLAPAVDQVATPLALRLGAHTTRRKEVMVMGGLAHGGSVVGFVGMPFGAGRFDDVSPGWVNVGNPVFLKTVEGRAAHRPRDPRPYAALPDCATPRTHYALMSDTAVLGCT